MCLSMSQLALNLIFFFFALTILEVIFCLWCKKRSQSYIILYQFLAPSMVKTNILYIIQYNCGPPGRHPCCTRCLSNRSKVYFYLKYTSTTATSIDDVKIYYIWQVVMQISRLNIFACNLDIDLINHGHLSWWPQGPRNGQSAMHWGLCFRWL